MERASNEQTKRGRQAAGSQRLTTPPSRYSFARRGSGRVRCQGGAAGRGGGRSDNRAAMFLLLRRARSLDAAARSSFRIESIISRPVPLALAARSSRLAAPGRCFIAGRRF